MYEVPKLSKHSFRWKIIIPICVLIFVLAWLGIYKLAYILRILEPWHVNEGIVTGLIFFSAPFIISVTTILVIGLIQIVQGFKVNRIKSLIFGGILALFLYVPICLSFSLIVDLVHPVPSIVLNDFTDGVVINSFIAVFLSSIVISIIVTSIIYRTWLKGKEDQIR